MCSTIRPLLGTHCFTFLQVRPFCKAPTSTSNQNFILGHLLTPSPGFGASKCARLSAPFPGAHCFSFLQVRLFWKGPTIGSHQNFILGHLLTPTQRFEDSKCA